MVSDLQQLFCYQTSRTDVSKMCERTLMIYTGVFDQRRGKKGSALEQRYLCGARLKRFLRVHNHTEADCNSHHCNMIQIFPL